ncbi:reverse transcriptase domain-containing protein [Tanacetum coccineum]
MFSHHSIGGQSSERNVCCKRKRHDSILGKSKNAHGQLQSVLNKTGAENTGGGTEGKIHKYSGGLGSSRRGRRYVDEPFLNLSTETSWEEKSKSQLKQVVRFSIINGILYKKSFLGPWLRCVGPLQANYVLREIHEGSCSMHAGTRSVVAKALRIGYYWPTMHEDSRKLIQACKDCQVHKPVPRNPQQKLSPITSPWPFYKWGIDIAGPFPEGPGKVKFLIVAIDYFTKWIEAKPVATITGSQIKKFVWDNIVCRFGLPGEIISDNEKQFQDNPFKDWCEKLCIRQHFASVKHPQTNGLVERANRSLGEGIKARLDERSKNWMEELPHVLWAHRTNDNNQQTETPRFSLTSKGKMSSGRDRMLHKESGIKLRE